MARLFGYIGNRPDLGAKVLEAEARIVSARQTNGPLGWGVGYYQGGEVLLRRRPLDERTVVPLADVLNDVRTDVLIGHVRQATVGSLRTENTHPFRFRQWLFAHTGTIAGFDALRDRLLESLPEFLRRNVRGDTDSELLFHLFLSFLHDAGKLQSNQVDPPDVRAALRASLALVDRLSAEEGAEPLGFNLLVTNGEHVVAVHANDKRIHRQLVGRHDLEEVLGDDGLRRVRIPDMASVRFCLLVADLDPEVETPRFTPVPDRTIVTLTRANDPATEPL
jgi:predicted glutamine amidotransferase